MAKQEKQKRVTFISVLEIGIKEGKKNGELVDYISENLPENLKQKYDVKKITKRLTADMKYLTRKQKNREEKLAKKNAAK